MRSAPVGYFDGRVSTRRTATLTLTGEQVTLRTEDGQFTCLASQLSIPAGVGAVRRTVRFPDGGQCELDDPALLADLELAANSNRAASLLHRWEKSLKWAMISLVLVLLAVLLLIRYGLPMLARHIAFALPAATEHALGREALATLDKLMMQPSKLDPQRRAQLTSLFTRVAGPQKAVAGYRLEFRTAPAVGANAFALPSGIVVITDDLVDLARNDEEIAAVLAHELGHVRGRHILRHVLQSSAAGLIVATLTGDITSITSLAATLPTALVNASFSREFEYEADDAAIAWMKTAHVPPQRYAEILARLQAQLDVRHGEAFEEKKSIRNYLSTHPDTAQRIRRIMGKGEP